MDKLFNECCYDVLRMVLKGRVTMYKEIAEKLNTRAYRAIDSAMNKNPYSPKVPCHRVVLSSGNVGGFTFGVDKKRKFLEKKVLLLRMEK